MRDDVVEFHLVIRYGLLTLLTAVVIATRHLEHDVVGDAAGDPSARPRFCYIKVSVREDGAAPHDHLAQRILNSLSRPGVYRCLVDLQHWTLLKWLDDPAPFFDWRASMTGDRAVHPADRHQMTRMAKEFVPTGTASGVLRMLANGGGWAPVHVMVNRVELDTDVYAGMATLRVPTEAEITAAGFDDVDDAPR